MYVEEKTKDALRFVRDPENVGALHPYPFNRRVAERQGIHEGRLKQKICY